MNISQWVDVQIFACDSGHTVNVTSKKKSNCIDVVASYLIDRNGSWFRCSLMKVCAFESQYLEYAQSCFQQYQNQC